MASHTVRGAIPLRVFAGLVSAHSLVQVACIASSVLGVALSQRQARSAIVLVLILAAFIACRFRGPDVLPSIHNAGSPRTSVRWIVWVVTAGAGLWVVSLWARLWVLAYERPSYDWDGLYYHIPAIHEWVVAGRLHWLDSYPDVPFVNYPMSIEAHTFLMHQAFDSSRLVDACNLWYWPLAFFAVVLLARHLGAVGPWPWLGAALVGGAPVLVCQSVTTYSDPGSAACVMAAVTASVLLVFHEGLMPWRKALLWGATVGLVLGSKGTGLPMAAAIVMSVAAVAAWKEGRRHWSTWLPRIAVGLGVALTVGGYWYARNAWHTGNPVHPIQLRLGAHVLVEGYDPSWMMRDNQPPWLTRFPTVARVPVSWLQLDAPIEGYAPVGGLGYIWPAAGIPSILVLTLLSHRRYPGIPRTEVAFAVGLVLVLLVLQPAAWWSRFTVWLHVLGLACLATVLTRAASDARSVVRLLAVVLSVSVAALAAWEAERTLALEQAKGRVLSNGGRRATYLTSQDALFPGMADQQGFAEFLRADGIARSRWSRAGTLLGGTLALPLGQRQIHLLPVEPTDDDLARLDVAGVVWVIWDVAGAGEVPSLLRQEAVEESAYSPAPDVNFHVLRLRPLKR